MAMTKVLIANKFEQSGIDGLKALGCDVRYEPDLGDQALPATMASVQPAVLVVRSTKVGESAMVASLKLIVRAGAGVNTIDVKAATARGVQVANCPGKNAIAVAELAFGLLLALDRRIPDNVADLRAGKWNKKEYSKARGLYGATLGLLGTGAIARELMIRAAAFGMPLVVWSRRFNGVDRPMSAGEAASLGLEDAARLVPIRIAPSPEEVAARSDVLSVHLALAPETKHIVNAAVLGRLKAGSLRPRRKTRSFAWRSTCSRWSPRRRPATSRIRLSARRVCTARTTSARPPTRRRKRLPPRPFAS
jgi:D-3-phosphoglycerate dehydrogenase